MLVDGGYITAADMRYHFFVTDHLGNVRVVVNSAGYVQGAIKDAAYIKDCVYWYENSIYAETLCDVSVEREDSLAFPDMLDGPYRRKIIKTLN